MKTLHYNCPAGLSGDMNLGAMIDLGVSPERLVRELQKLGFEEWHMEFVREGRRDIFGTRCRIQFDDGHHHRTFADIRAIIGGVDLAEPVRRRAVDVFRVLAESEARVHGIAPDDVHFHEIGALDSILDIVGAAVCWHELGIERITASTLELGGGTVQCAHGHMPVPAPATARLLQGVPVSIGGVGFEATTPTGAALLVGSGCRFGQTVAGRMIGTGIGVGGRDDPHVANVVYVSLLESDADAEARAAPASDEVIELVTNLDDMPPERVAFLADSVMAAGALDVWQLPATFKKGRLGCVFSVLIQPQDRERITALILNHSTTIGVRWRVWNRSTLERACTVRESALGPVRVKSVTRPDGSVSAKPEFDDVSRMAREHGVSIAEVERRLGL